MQGLLESQSIWTSGSKVVGLEGMSWQSHRTSYLHTVAKNSVKARYLGEIVYRLVHWTILTHGPDAASP
jgi:hypothetical protein